MSTCRSPWRLAGARWTLDDAGRRGIVACVVVFVVTIGFFATMGYSAPRLAGNSVPPILGATAIVVRAAGGVWPLRIFLAVVAIAALGGQVTTPGPYD